jgi:uncharacterized membrane protein YjgN (DUF898 family)
MSANEPTGSLSIRFTGSGSEYFRIWLVNLLLIVLTFTLYWPFARARRLAYFQSNTVVDGQPLGFHGNPKKMFRGYLLMLVLGGAYSVASQTSPMGALVAVLVLAVVWPALWRASMQFRLANTSWRGVRFAFTGDLKGAYAAMAPAFLPALAFVLLGALMGFNEGDAASRQASAEAAAPWMGVVMLLAMAAMPWLMARVKRYQHDHYHWAGQQTQLHATTAQFYGLSFKMAGVMLGAMLAFGVLVGAIALMMGGVAVFQGFGREGADADAGVAGAAVLFMAVAMVLFYFLIFFVLGSYGLSRTQNLIWGTTRSKLVRFTSDLRLRPTLQRLALNFFLTLLTLGFYRPFAVVAMTRLRLEAMAVEINGSVDEWVAQAPRMDDAAGDAAGDFFGIDMGL